MTAAASFVNNILTPRRPISRGIRLGVGGLISGGILDSIATLRLVLHFEEQYGIVLEAHEADKEHLDTIRSIATLLASKAR